METELKVTKWQYFCPVLRGHIYRWLKISGFFAGKVINGNLGSLLQIQFGEN